MTATEPTGMSAWVAIGLSALVVAGDVGSRFFGGETRGQVTASEVATLSNELRLVRADMKELSGQLNNVPKQEAVSALAARIDKHDGAIADLYNITTGIRHDVDNRLPPVVYRNPQH